MTILRPDPFRSTHRKLWAKLERAKQRFLVPIKLLRLPPFSSEANLNIPLLFQFPDDTVDGQGNLIPAITGHQNGVIAIRLMEADSILRERTRVELNEPHRSLIGHFRHEYGHYLDLATWPFRDQAESIQLFGDPYSKNYEWAKSRFYSAGPNLDWSHQYVSPYASMHPWEDFAETVSVYLDVMAIWSNAKWFGWIDSATRIASVEKLVEESLRVACFISECNLDMGLSILLPGMMNSEVMAKLACVHRLCFPDTANVREDKLHESAGVIVQ